MDNIFDLMLDTLNDPTEEFNVDNVNEEPVPDDNIINEYEIKKDIAGIRAIKVPRGKKPALKKQMVEIMEFDENYNMLNPYIREQFKNELIFNETDLFTEPINTTNTMEGFLSNVVFHEEEMIENVAPDDLVVIYKCNYGKYVYPGYTEPVHVKKTNRGRKKKERVKKDRKKQGNGDDFNSQLTFIIRDPSYIPVNGIIPSDIKVYKFKVFRTGKLQLPGALKMAIDDIIKCVRIIVEILNYQLHYLETDPAKITNIINVNPVMKNYRFVIKLPPGHIMDLEALLELFTTERNLQRAGDTDWRPECPPLFTLKYANNTRLSIKFRTPIKNKPDKNTKVNIFMSGKVNILGSYDTLMTQNICTYIHWLIDINRDTLIVRSGYSKEIVRIDRPFNILLPSENELDAMCENMVRWPFGQPTFSLQDEPLASIIRELGDQYDARYKMMDRCLQQLLIAN